MQIQKCDNCQSPAVFFYCSAVCVSGGKSESSECVSLCSEHAAIHEQKSCRASLNQLLNTLVHLSGQGWTGQNVQFTIAMDDEEAAVSIRKALLHLCGGKATLSSPETVAENLRQAVAHHPRLPAVHFAASDCKWEVQWEADQALPVLDQWQCGDWSRRISELILGHGCDLKGWHVDHTGATRDA
jgi:hypothetical protein